MNKHFKWIDTCETIDWKALSHLYKVSPLGDKPEALLKTAFINSRFTYFVYDNVQLIGVGRALE